ncbi:nucleotide-binding universal stress UspA family protein [Actinoplanes octamycinicus]|uniref:Nucleotide-binding universal stress UspA family protein n=1 Tax=Actinoplanes octamycinicus TaxID=135948 RepID=A0A7W7M4W9_9ACTN|nr:hypothetical protein [Actinoplanes octamycinicus]MBB4737088.1 nucleotide-binding universal stress UspA family protein [Actinoplanes octamycinicus]GIE63363.1 hypothetical protein Aoc01nite_87650 [Actinoplanes octamycinicus]
MPSQLHETLIEMFRDRPAFAADLLDQALRIPVPEFDEAHLSSADFTNVAPTEYRADAVVTLIHEGAATFAIIIEVQLRIDGHKRFSWPAYVATLYARLGCPVALLAICPTEAIARWAAVPIAIGPPGSTVFPMALGPEQVPVIIDPEEACHLPEMAILSTLAHASRPDRDALFNALFTALDTIEPGRAALYTDFVLAALPPAARMFLEEFMATTSHHYQSDFARRYFKQGEAQARAEAVLAVLDARGIETPELFREKMLACTDQDRLARLIQQAATARELDDLDFLDDMSAPFQCEPDV